MLSLRISLLLSLVLVSLSCITGGRHDSDSVHFLVSDFSEISEENNENPIEIEARMEISEGEQYAELNLPSQRTLRPLLYGTNVLYAPASYAPTSADNILSDPAIQINDVNREFLKALIMALQGQPTENLKPVTENQEDEQTNLIRTEPNAKPAEATMIDDKITREFIIGFIKGIQTSNQ